MTFRIQLLPSGKEFMAARNETLLDSALRAGVAVKYSCNSGACGDCNGRLVSGQVRDTQPHDFRFSEAQKEAGYMLMCCTAPESDLVIEAQEIGSAEEIPLQKIVTRVEKLEPLQDDILILHLRTPRSQTLHFLAGQHVSLSIDGVLPRNKSVASCPCNAMNLQFHIHRVQGDAFSEYVFDQLQPGQEVTLEGPSGHFTLDEASKRPIVFVAYETGFAPIKSIIEHTFALEAEQPIHLYWMVRHGGRHYLQNLCRSWVDALDNFTYTPLQLDDGGGSSWEDTDDAALDVRDMEALAAAITADYPDLSGFDVYLTAPDSAMDRIAQLLGQHGLPPAQLHQDVMQRV
ncbi:MAG TPA: 2Fe-2S iron-sulfur cluster-binding protein [Gallionellaceae bacterium]|nr:2Fe-2S iron-sulfur cluster-binding protein [Gallionellaceae bacterium]